MKLLLLIIVVICLMVIGCNGDRDTPTPTQIKISTPSPTEVTTHTDDPDTISPLPDDLLPAAQMLETAYMNDDKDLLVNFFLDWQSRFQSLSDAEIEKQSREVRAVYEVYSKFYNPFDLASIVGPEIGVVSYEGVPFIIVQNSMYIQVINDHGETTFSERIIDFRPILEFEDVDVVYLTHDYQQLINRFLAHGAGSVDNCCDEESDARLAFINQVALVHSHDLRGWAIETPPTVSDIIFNSKLSHVTVSFRIISAGGETVLMKVDDGWEIKHSELSWTT